MEIEERARVPRAVESSAEAILRWRGFPTIPQAVLLAAAALLVLYGLRPALRAEANPALGVIWLAWWSLLPFLALLTGRLWCAVCPAAGLADWAQAAAGRAGAKPAPAPVQQASAWLGIAAMLATGLAFLAAALETNGPLTALLLGLMTAGAVGLSLMFRGRAWCRWACPLGLMLGIYSRFGVAAVAAGPRGPRAAARAARGCPQLTSPVSSRRRHDCVLCGVCLKQGAPRAVSVRAGPGTPGGLSVAEAVAVPLLFGLLLVDTVRMTPLYLSYMSWSTPLLGSYTVALTAGGLAVLGVVTALQMGAAWRLAPAGEARQTFRQLSLALAPLALGMHLALSAQHLVGGGPGLVQGIAVEFGLAASGHMPPSDAYLVNLPLKVLQYGLLAVGAAVMFRALPAGWKQGAAGQRLAAAGVPVIAAGAVFQLPMTAVC